MRFKCNLIVISFIVMVINKALQELRPNYDYEYKLNDFRKKFIENRRQNILKNKRTNILDKYLFNNTVYLDGIIHYEINENNTKIDKIENAENEFRMVLAMNGVKYTYKRGLKWRTWREISQDGGKKIVCYVCNSMVVSNCSNCHSGGYWTIEDKPPCPYEIFSIKNDRQICAKYYAEYTNVTNDCPSVIKFEDLGVSCDNPIETIWRIRRDYANINAIPAFICNGKKYCDITTLYTIDSQGISFRIINGSNNIIYSRVMRNGEKNYACIDDCGFWDPNTKKITAQQNPLSFDLLGTNKMKREDIFGTSVTSLHKSTKSYKLKNKFHHKVNKKINMSLVISAGTGMKPISELNVESTTMSHCKKLEKTERDYEDQDSDYEY